LDNPLHVILNNSKLAYRIYVILIAIKELIKKKVSIHGICNMKFRSVAMFVIADWEIAFRAKC
jgi:hypothetical protein